MAAFRRAVDLGYRFIETDVHLTADNVLVAFHDSKLDRLTDRTGAIGELSWEEVRQARIGGKEPIPLFEDLLREWPDVRINVDPKSDRAVIPLVNIVRDLGAIDRVCVGSFYAERINRAKAALGPTLCTSPAPLQFIPIWLRALGLPVPVGNYGCVQVPTHLKGIPLVTRRFVKKVQGLGMQVHVWTINDEPTMHRLFDLGVDAIMTDRLELLRDVMQQRGIWEPSRRKHSG